MELSNAKTRPVGARTDHRLPMKGLLRPPCKSLQKQGQRCLWSLLKAMEGPSAGFYKAPTRPAPILELSWTSWGYLVQLAKDEGLTRPLSDLITRPFRALEGHSIQTFPDHKAVSWALGAQGLGPWDPGVHLIRSASLGGYFLRGRTL